MRVKVISIGVLVLLVAPTEAPAQNLAGLVKRLFDVATINAPSTLPTGVVVAHQPHFIVGESLKLTTREMNVALASQLASFPLPSSSGGFSFSINDRGEVVPSATAFGPAFAERGITIGRRQRNFGFSFQTTGYSSFEGIDLDSGGLTFIREHNDCCPGGVGVPTNVTNFTPEFERDLLRSSLDATIETRTTALFANYGVTDRFDVGVVVPFVNVRIDATVNAEVLRTASSATPLTHSFDGLGASTASFSESGSATGIGDILLRSKYNFFRDQTTAMAAGIDLRLPTGNADDLLGTGAFQAKLQFIGSAEYGNFSPHVNFGYTFSAGDASEEATSFDLDPTQYALNTLPGGFNPATVELSVPDEVNYTFGLNVAAHPKVSLGFDVHGRTIRDVARFSLQDTSYANRGAGALPSAAFSQANEFSVESRAGNLNLLMGVIGAKFNVASTLLLNVTVLFPMNDDGLKPKATPVVGFDYVF